MRGDTEYLKFVTLKVKVRGGICQLRMGHLQPDLPKAKCPVLRLGIQIVAVDALPLGDFYISCIQQSRVPGRRLTSCTGQLR